MKKNRKAQIETFGLAFIVILITIGFFIYVSYKSHATTENPQKEFTNDKMATDFVLSIIETSVENCKEYTVRDLIIDCARDHRLDCGGEDTCSELNKSIYTMLNKTFMQRNIPVRFFTDNIKNYDGNEIDISYMNCNKDSLKGQSGIVILPLYPGTAILEVNICS